MGIKHSKLKIKKWGKKKEGLFNNLNQTKHHSNDSSQKSFAEKLSCKIEGREFLIQTEDSVDIFPIDGDEIARSNTLHFLEKELWDKTIFSAPITNRLQKEHDFRVLDVGCGSGVWTLDMATTYRNASFVGVDISGIFPSEIKPINVEFMMGNVISGLNFKSNSFDYVFMRNMKSAIPINDWPNVLDELLRVLKPNSWLEIIDQGEHFQDGTDEIKELLDTSERKINEKYGLTFKPINLVKNYFLEKNPDGVTDFQSFEKKLPISGNWDTPLENKLAEIGYADLYWGANNIKHSLDHLGLSPEEYDKLIDRALKSIKDVQCTYKIHRLIARKV